MAPMDPAVLDDLWSTGCGDVFNGSAEDEVEFGSVRKLQILRCQRGTESKNSASVLCARRHPQPHLVIATGRTQTVAIRRQKPLLREAVLGPRARGIIRVCGRHLFQHLEVVGVLDTFRRCLHVFSRPHDRVVASAVDCRGLRVMRVSSRGT